MIHIINKNVLYEMFSIFSNEYLKNTIRIIKSKIRNNSSYIEKNNLNTVQTKNGKNISKQNA